MASARDRAGKFQKGNPGGPGRRPLAAELALPFIEGVTMSVNAGKVVQVMDRLHKAALAGNTQAAALWMSYAIGKPSDTQTNELIEQLTKRIDALEERLVKSGPNGTHKTT